MTDTDISTLEKLSGPGSAEAFKIWREGALERHVAGLEDGTVYAVGEPYPLSFGGQRNFGGIGTDPGILPSWGVKCSDDWRYDSFRTEADALAFVAAHPKPAEVA